MTVDAPAPAWIGLGNDQLDSLEIQVHCSLTCSLVLGNGQEVLLLLLLPSDGVAAAFDLRENTTVVQRVMMAGSGPAGMDAW